MKRLKFIFRRIKNFNFSQIKATASKIAKETGKNKTILIIDIFYCFIRYQAGYNDYYLMGFYNLKARERKTYLTSGKNNTLVAKYNPKEYRDIYDNKIEFNKLFTPFLKREWLDIRNGFESFEKFTKNKKEFATKLVDECGGVGFEIIKINKKTKLKDTYDYLINSKHYLVEEVVIQHKKLNTLYPKSVNTLRIVTFKPKKEFKIIIAYIRLGNGGIVDNTCSGGMLSLVDLKTGVIKYPAVDDEARIYHQHPVTGAEIKGFQIPYWNETLAFVSELVSQTKELGYIGWDIAITDKGPLLIEGNPYPVCLYQFPVFTPNKKGILSEFEVKEK